MGSNSTRYHISEILTEDKTPINRPYRDLHQPLDQCGGASTVDIYWHDFLLVTSIIFWRGGLPLKINVYWGVSLWGRGLWDLVTTVSTEAKINGSWAIAAVTLKPSESYQPAAAQNTTVCRHVHTNSHYYVESVLTAVIHRARNDERKGYLYVLICQKKYHRCSFICSSKLFNKHVVNSYLFVFKAF